MTAKVSRVPIVTLKLISADVNLTIPSLILSTATKVRTQIKIDISVVYFDQ